MYIYICWWQRLWAIFLPAIGTWMSPLLPWLADSSRDQKPISPPCLVFLILGCRCNLLGYKWALDAGQHRRPIVEGSGGPFLNHVRESHKGKIYIYIYLVKLKIGPIFALKIGPFFCFWGGGGIFENPILPAERRGFLKNKQKTTKKQFFKLKIGPIMLRNILGPVFNFNLDQFLTLEFCCLLRKILGPVFNFNLDQFLTLEFCYLFLFFCWNPYLYSVFSKNAKLKETQKRKKTLFVNTHVLIVLVMSVFFCIFHFCCFWISMFFFFFQRCFW